MSKKASFILNFLPEKRGFYEGFFDIRKARNVNTQPSV
jgi:hypothetical protein